MDEGNMPPLALFFYANLYFKRLTCENNLPRRRCLNFQVSLSSFSFLSQLPYTDREKNHQTLAILLNLPKAAAKSD